MKFYYQIFINGHLLYITRLKLSPLPHYLSKTESLAKRGGLSYSLPPCFLPLKFCLWYHNQGGRRDILHHLRREKIEEQREEKLVRKKTLYTQVSHHSCSHSSNTPRSPHQIRHCNIFAVLDNNFHVNKKVFRKKAVNGILKPTEIPWDKTLVERKHSTSNGKP